MGEIVEFIGVVEREISGSLSAINATSVTVTFNKEVEALAEADVTASNKTTGEKQYVKSVELAEDGKSATVTFYEALTSGETYTVAVKDAGSADLEFVVGVPTTIEVETAQTAKATVAYAVKYKVLDENGLDITATTKVKYESNVPVTDGKITLGKDATAFVYITALDKDGKAIANTKTAKITVTGQVAKAVKLISSTIDATVDTKAEFEAADFKEDHTLRLDETTAQLQLFVEDQFGDKDVAAGVTFESLDRTVAIVDRTTGEITPLKAGKVAVRVTVGDVKQIIELTVEKAAVVDSISVDKAEFSISDKLSAGQTVKVTVKDQYGDTNEAATGSVKAEIKSGTGLVTVESSVNAVQGVAPFTVKPVFGKEGTAVIEFSYDVTVAGKTTTFTDSTTVTVTKAGTIADYTVEGFETELDKYEGADAKNTTAMNLSVFGVDAEGVKVGDELGSGDYEVTIKDADGKTVAGNLDAENNANLKADATYTVEVKVGSLVVFTETFTVVDTTPEADKTVVKFTASSVSDVNADLNLFDDLLGAIKVTTGTTEETITAITFTSDNSSVIASDAAATAITLDTQGEAYLTIQSVTVNGEEIAVDNVEIKAVIDYSKVKYADVENDVTGTVKVHTVLDTDGNAVTGNYANGILTIEHDFTKLTEELGGAPSVAKWVGAHIAGPSSAVKAAVLNVEGTDPRSFKDVAFETEAGFTDGFFYFFPALEAGNTNNLTIAWSDADGKVIKVEKLQVKYINSNTP